MRPGVRVLARYVLFQTPGWFLAALAAGAAVRWFEVAPRWAWLGFAAWVAKDFVLYPFVRVAYAPGPGSPGDALVGTRVRADEMLAPEGWVRVGAELWRARLAAGHGSVPAGTPLRVEAVEGLTLRVAPISEAE